AATGGGAPESSGAATRTGEKPPWVDGADPRFPNKTFMCAVGLAPERSAAENAGYTALSKIFSSKVNSSSKDFLGAYAKTGAPDLEVQSTENLTQVSTQAVLQGVKIMEVWTDPKPTVYALACLERAKVAQLLQTQIAESDKTTGQYLDNAARMDKAGRIKELSRAMDTLLAREAANTQLRLVDTDGVGVAGPYSVVDVTAALEAAVEALKVGVKAQGPYDTDFRGALIQGLTSRGYKVNDLSQEPEGVMDVLVSATIRVEDGGAGTGTAAATHFARGVIQVEVKNVAQNKIIGSFNESRKEGSRNKEEAERRSVRNLASKIVSEVGAKIDATMKGR
ncbi:MAG TPA: LPP20 family lipoprotein, partial [Myxococcota bacterium]|nr:LPP20 family lipoprotein [Myxococcota bacterium]